MSRKSFFWRALGTLIFVGLLAGLLLVGGTVVHYTSWSQGYTAGQLAAEGEEGDVAPETMPHAHWGLGYPGQHFFYPGYFVCGGIVKIGIFLLLLVVFGKLLRCLFWGRALMHGGPWGMGAHHYWGKRRHWHRGHPHFRGPVPPWCWGYEEPSEEQGEPDAETDAAEA
jgi:hypothetical protein